MDITCSCGACYGGHSELANFMILKGADDVNSGLCGACKGGKHELAELMISKGANDFNSGLCSACDWSQLELVELMIEKGAIQCYKDCAEHFFKK